MLKAILNIFSVVVLTLCTVMWITELIERWSIGDTEAVVVYTYAALVMSVTIVRVVLLGFIEES